MPLTNAEFDFLNAYVYEAYTPQMTGPHFRAVRALGAAQWDLSWLLTARDRKALAEGKNQLGFHHPEPVPIPWSSKDEILSRGQKLRAELEQPGEPCAAGHRGLS
jgi:hypothetical protein